MALFLSNSLAFVRVPSRCSSFFCQIVIHAWDNPFAFFNDKEPVDRRQSHRLDASTWPSHLDGIDASRISYAEVNSLIVRRFIAAAAQHVHALALPSSGQVDGRSDRIARALRATDQLERDP